MRVRVTSTLPRLERDLRDIAAKARPELSLLVRKETKHGNTVTQAIARARSGPHGRLYYKRITWEMTGLLRGEYGPHGEVVGNAVGAGWRHGPGNTDLEKSLDVIGPAFEKGVGDLVDKWFW